MTSKEKLDLPSLEAIRDRALAGLNVHELQLLRRRFLESPEVLTRIDETIAAKREANRFGDAPENPSHYGAVEASEEQIRIATGLERSPLRSVVLGVSPPAPPDDDAFAAGLDPAAAALLSEPRKAFVKLALEVVGLGFDEAKRRVAYIDLVAPATIEKGNEHTRNDFGHLSGCGLVLRGLIRKWISLACGMSAHADARELFAAYVMGHALSDLHAIAARCNAWRSPGAHLEHGAPLCTVDGVVSVEAANEILLHGKRAPGSPLVPGDWFMLGGETPGLSEHVATATRVTMNPPSPIEEKNGRRSWAVTSVDGGQLDEKRLQLISQRVRVFSTDNQGRWFASDEGRHLRPVEGVGDFDALAFALGATS